MNTHYDILVATLRKHTQALALPRGRKVGSPGHAVTRNYLLDRMKRTRFAPFTGDSFELPYRKPHPNTKKMQDFTNLVGVIPGRDRTLPPILLGAHYDSVIAAPCVDDNATSVALNLAIAEAVALQPLERDLIIAFFDAEEPPFFLGPSMGSRRFCEDYCRGIRFAAVIVTDLIGHDASIDDLQLRLPRWARLAARMAFPNIGKLIAVMGSETDGTFPAIIESAASQAKALRVVTTQSSYVGPMSDHAAFAKAGQPILFLSCGQGQHYHAKEDDMRWINFDKLAHITRFIADIIDRIDATPHDTDRTPFDPFELEMRMLRRALGPALVPALKRFGMTMPTCREELDDLLDGGLNEIQHSAMSR
jgi:hypothetical protein